MEAKDKGNEMKLLLKIHFIIVVLLCIAWAISYSPRHVRTQAGPYILAVFSARGELFVLPLPKQDSSDLSFKILEVENRDQFFLDQTKNKVTWHFLGVEYVVTYGMEILQYWMLVSFLLILQAICGYRYWKKN